MYDCGCLTVLILTCFCICVYGISFVVQYKRTVGGVEVCADGNATDNWDTPPAGGWGYHSNGDYLSVL